MDKIRKGDRVIACVGRNKGKQDTVLAVFAKHATVGSVNVTRKHVCPNPMLGTIGGAVDKVMPIHISNVVLVDVNGEPSRVGIKAEGDVKIRMLKATGTVVGA